MSRRSYSGLVALPAWGAFDDEGRLIGSCRAKDAKAARKVLHRLPPADVARARRIRRLP